MCLRFTGKTIETNIELSPINGLEPASHEKGRVPISNRLRPKDIFQRNRCASDWSDICDHSNNPVNRMPVKEESGGRWFSGRPSSLSGDRHRTVLVAKYVRTQCTDVARCLVLKFLPRPFTNRAHELPMILVGTMRYG